MTTSRIIVGIANGLLLLIGFLNKDKFPKPEGLTFNLEENLFISNKGNLATIHLASKN